MNTPAILEEIQKRWGHHSIRPARELSSVQLLSTGIPELDTLLDGGIPRSRISALVGQPTSGMRTLAFRIAAHTQQQGEVVYLDLGRTFNPAYAAACGIDLDRLLIARPPEINSALELMRDIAASHAVTLLICDPGPWRTAALPRLQMALAASPMALLLLSEQVLPGVHIRIQMQCVGWLYDGPDISGCQLRASIEQHPTLCVGGQTQFNLRFPEGMNRA